MDGKVCIVTGSSSGLGRAISIAYAKQGALLVCADITAEARPEIQDETEVATHLVIRESGGKAIFVKSDVSIATEFEALIQSCVAEYGRLDVLVNNAGISVESKSAPSRIHEVTEEAWNRTMDINAKSVFLGCKYATAQMLSQEPGSSGDRGWIINMSSIFGLVGGHHNDIETAIFVNASEKLRSVESLQTKHPFRGIGRPNDVVGAAIFLATEASGWITGVCLPVDGGYTCQ